MSEDNQDHQSHPNENLVVAEPDPDPADEAAGSRPERPQSRGVTRRALLGGTALGAGLLAYTSDYEDGGVTHSIARAATVPDEPLITVGPEDDPVGYIFESNGDWVFKHEASGNEFFYNSTDDRWETNQELDVPALVADQLDITNAVGRASLTTDQTISNTTNTQVNLDQNDIEESSVVDVDLSNNRLQAEVTGRYLINAQIRWAGSADWTSGDRIDLKILTGGNIRAQTFDIHNGANEIQSQFLSTVVGVTGTPTNITIECRQDTGGNESLNSGSGTENYLEVIKVA